MDDGPDIPPGRAVERGQPVGEVQALRRHPRAPRRADARAHPQNTRTAHASFPQSILYLLGIQGYISSRFSYSPFS